MSNGVATKAGAPARSPEAEAAVPVKRRLRVTPKDPLFAAGLSFVLVGALWFLVPPFLETKLIPHPTAVFAFMGAELMGDTIAPQTVYEAFGESMRRLGIGLALSIGIGLSIGILAGAFKPVARTINDTLMAGLAMPALMWALLVGMWFGHGNLGPILAVILASLPFIIINVAEGVRAVPRDLIEMGRAFDMSSPKRLRHITIPALSPFFFAAVRYGFGIGWKALVISEIYAASSGAGWMIKYWRDANRSASLIGYSLFFVIFALLVERGVFGLLYNRVFRWRTTS